MTWAAPGGRGIRNNDTLHSWIQLFCKLLALLCWLCLGIGWDWSLCCGSSPGRREAMADHDGQGFLCPGTSLSELLCFNPQLQCTWQVPCAGIVYCVSTAHQTAQMCPADSDPHGENNKTWGTGFVFPVAGSRNLCDQKQNDLNCLAGHSYPWSCQSTSGNLQNLQHALSLRAVCV